MRNGEERGRRGPEKKGLRLVFLLVWLQCVCEKSEARKPKSRSRSILKLGYNEKNVNITINLGTQKRVRIGEKQRFFGIY